MTMDLSLLLKETTFCLRKSRPGPLIHKYRKVLNIGRGRGAKVQNIGGLRGAKLKTDNIAKLRIELKCILLEILSNKIKGTYIKLVHL